MMLDRETPPADLDIDRESLQTLYQQRPNILDLAQHFNIHPANMAWHLTQANIPMKVIDLRRLLDALE